MHKIPIDYTSIFIGQLDCKTDESAIREKFGKYGGIVGVQVLSKQNIVGAGRRGLDGQGISTNSGFAFVKFDGRESATRAVKAEVPHPLLPSFPLPFPSNLYLVFCLVLKSRMALFFKDELSVFNIVSYIKRFFLLHNRETQVI